YMKQRKQFGKTLDKFQALTFEMASMKVKIDGARYLLYDACNRRDRGLPPSVAAAEAKLACSEAASYVTNKAVQFHGGYGYIKDYPVERMYRDAKITEIYEGTSEVMKMVMSGEIFK
ncbi:MAG: acyl-CoA dehydrogenase family protein, partial [Anaerovoracaceae bacterium]